jgi:hypothetical protein
MVVGAPTYFGQHSPPYTPEDLSEHNRIPFDFEEAPITGTQTFVDGDATGWITKAVSTT